MDFLKSRKTKEMNLQIPELEELLTKINELTTLFLQSQKDDFLSGFNPSAVPGGCAASDQGRVVRAAPGRCRQAGAYQERR